MLRVLPYTGGGSYNPAVQNGDMSIVYGNVNGLADTGKVLNIIPEFIVVVFKNNEVVLNFVNDVLVLIIVGHVNVLFNVSVELIDEPPCPKVAKSVYANGDNVWFLK